MDLNICHAQTHHGPYLTLNEDGYKFDFDNDLYMVLDAFGGSGFGDEALKLAEEKIGNFFTTITGDPDSTQPFFYNPQYSTSVNALINALTYTHKLLLQKNNGKALDERGGVSGGFIVRDESYINIINIGTVRAYLMREGSLKLLLNDHSLSSFTSQAQMQIPHFPIGLMGDFHYTIKSLHAQKGDRVILMSDGVYHLLETGEIEAEFNKDQEGGEIIENLFQLANNKGNKDNQTLLYLEF